MLNAIAVVLTWVKIKNAEYEVVNRLRIAASNLGIKIFIIDNDGYKLWSTVEGDITDGDRITRQDCDFVICLHFESAKLYDVFSYTAVWNPPEFYGGPEYERNAARFASHDSALSCHSLVADAHARNIFSGFGRTLELSLPSLFHSVPAPHFEPSVSNSSRLFYVGINWERILGQRGRHHDLLELLDAEDLIDIYGPKVFLEVEPWEGFGCYRGEIPFDGRSVVDRIHDSGICLALSSKEHQRCGIMSNRLFEGLAAGAVIIANPNPFIDLYFSDCVYVIDDKQASEILAAEVRDLVVKIRSDPRAAREMALTAQRRFQGMFTLESCLSNLVEEHAQRVTRVQEAALGTVSCEVTIVLEYAGLDPEILTDMIHSVSHQINCVCDVIIICDARLEAEIFSGSSGPDMSFARAIRIYSDLLTLVDGRPNDDDDVRFKATGPLLTKAFAEIKTGFFCFMQPDDLWFDDHLASLAKILTSNPQSMFAVSGKIDEDKQDYEPAKRHLDQLRFDRLSDILHCALSREVGRFLYRASILEVLPQPLMQILDGFHNRWINVKALLKGPLVQTGRATYIHRRWQMDRIFTSYTEMQQANFVLDSFRGDSRWIDRAAQLPRISGALQSTLAVSPKLLIAEPNRLYGLGLKGDGVAMLRTGFSESEPGYTWVDGFEARVEFKVDEPVSGYDIVFLAAGRNAKSGDPQIVTISVNGEDGQDIVIGTDMEEIRILLPEKVDASTKKISIKLTLKHAEQVVGADGNVIDARRLGLRLADAGVFLGPVPLNAESELDVLVVERDRFYKVTKGGDGLALLRAGFSEPEPDYVWMDGVRALLAFETKEALSGYEIAILVAGRNSKAGVAQAVMVSINGVDGPQTTVDEGLIELRVPIPVSVDESTCNINVGLTLGHAEQVFDADGNLLDARYLGLQITDVGIFLPKVDPVLVEVPVEVAPPPPRARMKWLHSRF